VLSVSPRRGWRRRRRAAVLVVLLLVPVTLLHRALLGGEAFLPADLLGTMAPWKAVSAARRAAAGVPAWNVLRFDGITQFYPWRLAVRRSLRAGRLPLWNPYALAASGGAPLLANSQSAALYPPNLLFTLLPSASAAFGWVAAFHLFIAAAGMYGFLRALPVGRAGALLGAIAFSLSGPVVTWLALPTFLAVSCWLPVLLLLIKRAHDAAGTAPGRLAGLGAGATAGLLLLAGHLQVAFYCLLTAVAYALWQGTPGRAPRPDRPGPVAGRRGRGGPPGRRAGRAAGAPGAGVVARFAPGGAAEPGRLPGVQRQRPAAAQPRDLAGPRLLRRPRRGNVLERQRRRRARQLRRMGALRGRAAPGARRLLPRRAAPPGKRSPPPAERFFFAGVALLALLMAAGTPINLPFFFGVPGFAQTGSPARALLLFAFSVAVLAAIGLDRLRSAPGSRGGGPGRPRRLRRPPAAGGDRGESGGALRPRVRARTARRTPGAHGSAPVAGRRARRAGRGTLVLARRGSRSRRFAAAGCVALVFLDLATWGVGYNRTAPPEAVYPVTPGIRWLQANARGALIAPLNRDWSLGPAPPARAVLPPNALTVYGLHDVGGYDSLLPRRAKQRVQDAGNGEDPSPPENGNIVFVKSIGAARGLGARFLVAAPEAAEAWERRAEEAGGGTAGPLRRVYGGEDLVIFEDPEGRDWRPPADVIPGGTGAFRLGLFLGLAGVAALSAAATGAAFGFRRRLGRPS
jgi:hypothetical protein